MICQFNSNGSDNDGHGNENDQELIIIPIKNRTTSSGEGYSTENGVTVINFDKSKHVVCDKNKRETTAVVWNTLLFRVNFRKVTWLTGKKAPLV